MSWEAGYSAGVGIGMGEKAKSMLESQLSRYKGLSDVYETVASNPDVFPDVKQEALRRITLLRNVDPNNPESVKSVKGLADLTDIWKAQNNRNPLAAPNLTFQAATTGRPAELTPQTQSQPPPQQQQPQAMPGQAPSQLTAPQQTPAPKFGAALQSGGVQQSVGLPQGPPQGSPGSPQVAAQPGPPAQPSGPSGPAQQIQAQLEQRGITDPNAAQTLGEKVSHLAGPEPPTNGIATPEYKAWMANKQKIAEKELNLLYNTAEMKNRMDIFGAGGDMYGMNNGGVDPNSTLGKVMQAQWATDMALKRPRMQPRPDTIKGGPAVFFAGQWFIDNEPIEQTGNIRGSAGSSSETSMDRNSLGVVTRTTNTRTPIVGGRGTASGPPLSQGTNTSQQNQPSNAVAPPAASPVGSEYSADPEAEAYLKTRLPITDEASRVAYRMATNNIDAIRTFSGANAIGKANIQKHLQNASVYVPLDAIERKSFSQLNLGTKRVQQIGSLLDHVLKTGDIATAITLQRDILSFGSVFAKNMFDQTGQLSNQEQIWARAGFMNGLNSFISNKMSWNAFGKILETAGRASLAEVERLIADSKQNSMSGRPYEYIAGVGPTARYMAHQDAFTRQPLNVPGGASSGGAKAPTIIFKKGDHAGQPGYLLPSGNYSPNNPNKPKGTP